MLDNVPLFEVELEVLGQGWSQNSSRGLGVAYIKSILQQFDTGAR